MLFLRSPLSAHIKEAEEKRTWRITRDFYGQWQMWYTLLFFTVGGWLSRQTAREPRNEEKTTLPLTHLTFLARKYPFLPCPLTQTKHSPKSRISSCCAKLLIKSRGDLSSLLPIRWLIRLWKVHHLFILYIHAGLPLRIADSCPSSLLACSTLLRAADSN